MCLWPFFCFLSYLDDNVYIEPILFTFSQHAFERWSIILAGLGKKKKKNLRRKSEKNYYGHCSN